MKQLPLFRPTISQSLEVDYKKRLRRSQKNRNVTTQVRDLWTQDKDEEKEMALFFLDIRNFTPFVERHQASEVIYVIRKLFSTFQNIIRIHHGQIIETSGDGFYAAFGFDRSIGEAVNAAIRTGRAIIDMLNDSTFKPNPGFKIEIGIGLHAGRVATGSILLGGKSHMIVMGYPVNIASRLQAATKELNNNFIISSTAFDLWDNPPKSVASTDIHLKGVSDLHKIHMIGQPYPDNYREQVK